ncbi:diacylglycerol O-acyltransferase 1-like, partial [Tachysurus ichikawai]
KHQDYKDKGSSEATTNDGGIPVTIAVVSTEQAGSLDYKLAILPVEIKACNGSKIIETYAFLDPGSSATFCTEKLMEDLQVFTQASIPVGKENTEKVPQDHLPGTVGRVWLKCHLMMLRFLWWPSGNTSQPLAEYHMLVHLFDAVSSPSCANYALKKTAEIKRAKFVKKFSVPFKTTFMLTTAWFPYPTWMYLLPGFEN